MTRAGSTNRPSPAMCVSGRTIAEPRLAPNGCAVAFHVNDGGGSRLVRIDLDDADVLRPGPEVTITVDPPVIGVHPSGGGSWCWTPNSNEIVYASPLGIAIVAASGGVGRVVAPAATDETLHSITVDPEGSTIAFVVETDEGQEIATIPIPIPVSSATEVAEPQTATLPERCVLAPGDPTVFRIDPTFGPDGIVSWHEWHAPSMPWDHSFIVHSNSPEKNDPSEHPVGAVGQPRWSPNGTSFGCVTDVSDNPTAQRWLRVSINGTAINLDAHEHATPSWGAGQRSWCWAPTSEQVAFVRNEGGFARICIASVETGVVSELGKAWHLGLSWSRTPEGRSRIAAIRSGGVTPQQLVVYELFDREPPSRTTVARGPVGGWEAFRLPEPEVVTWSAVDGTALHGRLYVPRSTGSKKAPVVVAIHGGPTDQATVQFTTRYAYFLGLGWAVFVPDHRGSSGHGREFQQAMNGRWGELDVADVLSGITWLKSRVDVDADIVVLNGGSAGGFTVLHLLAQATEDSPIRGGIALYPVTDLAALDATTHRFERHYSATIVGPTSVYTQRSPVTYAARVKLPLLLLHGDADKVVSVQQSRDLVASIKANGGNVTYVEYADEGHGWRKPETTRNELEQIAEFLSLIAD